MFGPLKHYLDYVDCLTMRGSLIRYMPDEVDRVTSLMVYISMLFGWFSWNVEDHDLHSLDDLHMGSLKISYVMPKDAGRAFEEVLKCEGYDSQVNPIGTFHVFLLHS